MLLNATLVLRSGFFTDFWSPRQAPEELVSGQETSEKCGRSEISIIYSEACSLPQREAQHSKQLDVSLHTSLTCTVAY